jgi:diguanylate cyclase (GGDEF)-like protein/PAS domain S-box-containing protein
MPDPFRIPLRPFLFPDRASVREALLLTAIGLLVPGLLLAPRLPGVVTWLPGPTLSVPAVIAITGLTWALLLSAFLCRRYRGFCARSPELTASAQALARSRNLSPGGNDQHALQLFRNLIDESRESLFIIDARDGRILDVNEGACRNLGYAYRQLTRLKVPDIVSNYGDNIPRWDRYIERVRGAGHLVFESRHYRKDGSALPVEVSTRLVSYQGREYLVSVARDISERKAREAELEHLASTDPLTGAANRRKLYELLDHHLHLRRRYGTPVALVVMDLDHFKAINDRFGHEVGDEVLTAFACGVREVLRQPDMLARTGGEEFALLAPQTDRTGALAITEKVAAAVRALELEPVDRITASFGVAEAEPGEERDDLLRRADQALYRAKEAGRDRIEAA